MAKVVFLVFCATGISARHFVNVNSYVVPNSDEGTPKVKTVLERRNIEYGSQANLNQRGPSIDSLYRHNCDLNIHHISDKHHDQNYVKISENIDNNDNIVNDDENKLRTNVYPSDIFTYTTEYINDINVYTNFKPEAQTIRKNTDLVQKNMPNETTSQQTTNVQEPDISLYYRHGNTQNTQIPIITPKSNTDTATYPNNETKIKVNNNDTLKPSNHNNLMPQKRIFASNNTNLLNKRIEQAKINQPNGSVVRNEKINDTRPIFSNIGNGNRNYSISKKDDAEEEIPWVWGSEPRNTSTTTDKDDLLDRAAFTGDQCPTGKVKIEGVCVDKH